MSHMLEINVPAMCPNTISGEHRGRWTGAPPLIEGQLLVADAQYKCLLCGLSITVVTAAVAPWVIEEGASPWQMPN